MLRPSIFQQVDEVRNCWCGVRPNCCNYRTQLPGDSVVLKVRDDDWECDFGIRSNVFQSIDHLRLEKPAGVIDTGAQYVG